jgi:hypothetical protein
MFENLLMMYLENLVVNVVYHQMDVFGARLVDLFAPLVGF